MNITLPSDKIFVTFNFFDKVVTSNESTSYDVTSDNVLDVLKKARTDANKEYKKLKISEDTSGAIVISFFEDKTTLFSSKSVYSETAVEEAALRFLTTELLPALNADHFRQERPLIIFPPLGSEDNPFSKLGLSLDEALEHVNHFQKLSEENQGTIVLPVDEYVKRYELPLYSAVVNWGFVLRSLLKNRDVIFEDESLPLFADYAANMVTKGVWGSHASQLGASDKDLTVNRIFSKLHEITHKNDSSEASEAKMPEANRLLLPAS